MQKTLKGRTALDIAAISGFENCPFITKYFTEVYMQNRPVYVSPLAKEPGARGWRLFADCNHRFAGYSARNWGNSHKIVNLDIKTNRSFFTSYHENRMELFPVNVTLPTVEERLRRNPDTGLSECVNVPTILNAFGLNPKYKIMVSRGMLSGRLDPHSLSPAVDSETMEKVFQQLEEKGYLTPVPHRIAEDTPLRRKNVRLGADPEFEAYRGETVVVAHNYVGHTDCPVGSDGCGDQLEIRPAPSARPAVLVKNIKDLLRESSKYFDEISVRGDKYSLGGHIHFGGLGANFRLLEVLDNFIGKPLSVLNGSARGGFADLGGYRPQPHGFEYRTPPSAWLISPRFAKITLKLAKNLATKWANTKELTYEESPTDEDYQKIGGLTSFEIKCWRDMCSRQAYNPSKFMAAWSLPQRVKFKLVFKGRWHKHIKARVEETVHSLKRPIAKGRKTILLRFISFPSSKGGAVYGFSCPGCTEVSLKKYEGKIGVYGIPSIQHFLSVGDFGNVISCLKDQIVRDFNLDD
jgi:hypothetical protein